MTTNKKQSPEPAPRRERRSRTAEGDLKAFGWKLLKEDVEKDPLLRDRYIAHMTGFDIAKARREAMEEDFRLKVLKLGFKEMEKEPDWAKDLARDAIYEAMGKKPPEPKSEEEPYRPTLDDILEHYEMVADFMKRNGYGQPKTWEQVLRAFLDPKVMNAIENMIRSVRGQSNPPPSGANSNQTPPHHATEEQTTASGFDDFVHEPPPTPPPPKPEPNPFTQGPSTVTKQESAPFTYKGGRWTRIGEGIPPASSEAAKEPPKPDITNCAKDVTPPPGARRKTDQPKSACIIDNGPISEPNSEANPNPDQSLPPAFEATAMTPTTKCESHQDERTSTLESDDQSRPTEPSENRFSRVNAKAAKATKLLVNQTRVAPPMLQPDQTKLQEKVGPEVEAESPPSVIPSKPQVIRSKREKPFYDFDPDPVNSEDTD